MTRVRKNTPLEGCPEEVTLNCDKLIALSPDLPQLFVACSQKKVGKAGNEANKLIINWHEEWMLFYHLERAHQ